MGAPSHWSAAPPSCVTALVLVPWHSSVRRARPLLAEPDRKVDVARRRDQRPRRRRNRFGDVQTVRNRVPPPFVAEHASEQFAAVTALKRPLQKMSRYRLLGELPACIHGQSELVGGVGKDGMPHQAMEYQNITWLEMSGRRNDDVRIDQVADMRWEMVAGSATAGDGDSVAVGDAVARRILGVDQVGVRHT